MTNTKTRKNKISKRYFWFVFPVTILLYEFVLKYTYFSFSFESFLYTALFSVSIGLFITAVCTAFKPKIGNIISIVTLIALLLIFGSQFVYHQIFRKFYLLFSIQGAGNAIRDYTTSLFKGIIDSIPYIILILIPIVLYIILRKTVFKPRKTKPKTTVILFVSSIVIYLVTILFIGISTSGPLTSNDIYFHTYSNEHSINRFGVLTSMRLDFQHLLLPYSETDYGSEVVEVPDIVTKPAQEENEQTETTDSSITTDPVEQVPEEEQFVPTDNVMIIDFETLLNTETDPDYDAMNKYFSSLTPTQTNKYTGIFKGKNLIFMTCEALSKYAIRPDTTPTLYKMMTEGFYFTNFYTPSWTVSTSDGEYVACTGLIPKEGVWSFYRTGDRYGDESGVKNLMAFCMGNTLKALGYRTLAYHNHDYKYYKRNLSHPNMGYKFTACGNGLEKKINCRIWPQSDLEMINATFNDYKNEERFVTYYMTISGHLNYNFYGNTMALRNKSKVKNLNYSNSIKAYMATHIELDKALESLINKLTEAKLIDDTVIVITADHYPYGLTIKEMKEKADYINDSKFDIHKNNLIIWNKNLKEKIGTDKYACSIDILPTILNLFGISYDSRLLIGKDILSDSQGIAIYNDRSWITEYGKFNSVSSEFTSFKKIEDKKKYVDSINELVKEKFSLSRSILENNYYKYLKIN